MLAGWCRLSHQSTENLTIGRLTVPTRHTIAAMRAAHQLLVRPYFWGKTEHGRTQRPRSFVPASALVAKPGEAR